MTLLRPVPAVTAEQENHRFVELAPGIFTSKVDPVEPVPVGTYIVMCFRVTGYDPDCDGSLMGRFEQVNRHGESTGWEPTHVGLYPDTDLVVDHPSLLWADTPGEVQAAADRLEALIANFRGRAPLNSEQEDVMLLVRHAKGL